jgi:MFS family permease
LHPHRRNIPTLYAFWFLRDFQLWIPVWIVFLTIEQGFSLTAITSAEGLFLVGVVLLEVPTGAVADRWGRSRSLALGALTLAMAVLIFAFITSVAFLLTSFLLWSLASTLMSGADNALLFDTLKADGREADYERVAGRGSAIHWAGAALAVLLGGPVAAWLDIRTTIFIGSGTCLLTALVALSLWEAPRATAERPGERYWATIGSAFREMWRVGDVRTVVLLAGTAFAALEGVHYLVQPYLIDRDIAVGTTFSLLQVPMQITGIVGALAAAHLKGRMGTFSALFAIPAMGAFAFLALAFSPGLSAYVAFPLLYALGSCLDPIAGGYVNRRIGSERRATILSIKAMVTSLVLALFAPAIGFTTDNYGLDVAFATGGLLAAASLLVFGGPLIARRATIATAPTEA